MDSMTEFHCDACGYDFPYDEMHFNAYPFGTDLCKGCKVLLMSIRSWENKTGEALSFRPNAFKEFWGTIDTRKCEYCGISEREFELVDMRAIGRRRLSDLGIDRKDSNKPYDFCEMTNIVICCFQCNRIKSNFFTYGEMRVIGRAIGQVWLIRSSIFNARARLKRILQGQQE